MVYKRYIKKDGKLYGPYSYKNKKVDGKVISEYVGKSDRSAGKKEKISHSFLTLFVLVLCLGVLIVLSYANSSFTGKAVLDNSTFGNDSINNSVLENVSGMTEVSENISFVNNTSGNISSNETFADPLENNISVEINQTEELNITATNDSSKIDSVSQTGVEEVSLSKVEINTTQYPVVVGMPVKWKKKVSLDNNATKVDIELPKEAENIAVYKLHNETSDSEVRKTSVNSFSITGNVVSENSGNSGLFDFFKRLFKNISGAITGKVVDINSGSDSVNVSIEDDATSYEIEYETPAPVAIEEETSNGKIVIISSEYHYKNILAYSELPYGVEIKNIKLYYYDELTGEKVLTEFQAYNSEGSLISGTDTKDLGFENISVDDLMNSSSLAADENLVSFITWIVPHLSDQTYQIIINISKAEHMDSSKNFIEDIYDLVKAQDGIWSPVINNGDYVRVTFEKNLTNKNDITVYANGTGKIKIYEKDGSNLLSEINVDGEGLYKTYLINLEGSQDVFDLRIDSVEGLQFDYIVDPEGNYTGTSFDTAASGNGNPSGITQNGTYFWITDFDDFKVYQYYMNGTYTGFSFGTNETATNATETCPYPSGVAVDDNYIWVNAYYPSSICRYYHNGTYSDFLFDTGDAGNGNSGNVNGIYTNGTIIWVSDTSDAAVREYNATNGSYIGETFSTAGSGNTDPYGITFNGTYFWIVDNVDDGVYKYYANGSYTQTFLNISNASSGANANPVGITHNGTYFWVADSTDDEVYVYDMDVASPLDCGTLSTPGATYTLTSNVTATGTCFTISAANVTLNCNGYWINYSTGGTANTYGLTSNQFNTTIKNCNIQDGNWTSSQTTRHGIYFNNVDGGTVYNNTINVSKSVGLYLNTGSSSNNITLNIIDSISNLAAYLFSNSNNNIINFNNLTSNLSGGILVQSSNYNILTSNNGTSNSYMGIYIFGSWNNLTNNIGTTSSTTANYGGIRVDSGNNTLTNNTGISTASTAGIILYGASASNNTLTNNNGTSSSGYGIYLSSASNNTLTGNNGTSTSSIGIYLYLSKYNILVENKGMSSTNVGIDIQSSTYNNFTRNNGTSAASYGIYFYGSSDNNTFTEQTAVGNYGIHLSISNNNFFRDCGTISGSTTDVYINPAANSVNNTFLNCSYSSESNGGAGNELIRKWYYRANASYSNGTEISGANVSAWNSSGELQFTELTNSSGYISQQSLIDYINTGGTIAYASNYTINASLSGYTTDSQSLNVTLENNVLDGVFNLTDLPALDCSTLDSANTIYTLSSNVTSTGTCFTISAANVTLNCNGYWINYSTGGTANTYGITTTAFNTTIKNCNIQDGNFTSSEVNRHGILINSASNGTLQNNTINASIGAGIRITGSSFYNLVFNNTFLSDSNVGIYIAAGQFNNLTNNIGTTSSTTANYGGIRVDSGNNTLTNNTGISTASTAGIILYGASSSDNNLTDNNGTSNTGIGIYLVSSSNNNLTKNTGTSTGVGIFLSTSHNNTLDSNTGTTSGNTRGIYLLNSLDNLLINNTGRSFQNVAILISGSSRSNLTSNYGESNSLYGGHVLSSDNNTLMSNTFVSNVSYGFLVQSSNNNNLISNTGTSNTSYGIYTLTSSNNSFTLNTGTGNTLSGFVVQTTSNSTFTSNTGTSNLSYGVYILQSTNNTILNQTAKSTGASGANRYGLYIQTTNYTNFTDCYNITGVTGDVYVSSTGTSIENIFTNCTYSTESVNGADNYLIRKWYYQANASYANGTEVSGANVSAWNSSGELQFTELTNSSGYISQQSLIDYINTGGTIAYASNYTINASLSGYTTDSQSLNVTLENNVLDGVFNLTQDITPPYFTTIPSNATITYGNETLGVDFDAADDVTFDSYAVNDTRFVINFTGWLSNNSVLSAGAYSLNISINDSSGNSNATNYAVTVSQNPSSCGVLFNETSPINYSNTFLVWTNCTGNSILYRNGTSILNNSEQSLNAGSWNFTVIRNDTANYSNVYEERLFVVQDLVSPIVTISLPTSGQVFSTSTATFQVTTDENSTCNYSIDSWVTNNSMTPNSNGTIHEATQTSLSNGNYVALYSCADTFRNVNNTQNVSFSVSVTVSAGTGGSGSTSSGGGGGTAAVVNPYFSADVSSVEKTLALNRIEFGQIKITNEKNESRVFTVRVEVLNSIISFENSSITVEGDSTGEFEYRLTPPDETGTYTGKIIIESTGFRFEIPVVINVKTEKSLYDIILTIPKSQRVLSSGEILTSQIDLLQMGIKEKMDVTLNYIIKDFSGKVYLTQTETIAVDNQKTLQKEFDTSDLPDGNYVLGIELLYPDGVAVASSQFQIGNPEIVSRTVLIRIAAIVVLIGFLVVIYIITRRYRRMSKGFGK